MRSRLVPSLSLTLATCLPLATGCTELTGDDDPDGGPGPGPSGVCTTARLIAGNPISTVAEDPTAWTPSGFPALGEPPLRVFNLAARGRTVLVNTQQALWKLDLSAANPTFVRVFGADVGGIGNFQPSGACADGRTMLAHGLAWLPDGRLITADDYANSVLELSDPLAASCTVRAIAGTSVPVARADLNSSNSYMPGDVIGPGASARFAGPGDPVVDAAGNVYLWDNGNRKIKRIAADANRTVTTVWTLTAEARIENVNSMALRDGALYVGGIRSGTTRIWRIDLATGASTEFWNDDAFTDRPTQGIAPASSLPIAMIADGDDLIVLAYGGFVYRVHADATATHIAGTGWSNGNLTPADYAGTLDADEVPLKFLTMVSGASLHYADGHLLVPTFDRAGGIWDFTCP